MTAENADMESRYAPPVLLVHSTFSHGGLIGHSMGGLLAQHLAARTPCAALVLLAPVPPGVLWAQPRVVPHLARLPPRILIGRPVAGHHIHPECGHWMVAESVLRSQRDESPWFIHRGLRLPSPPFTAPNVAMTSAWRPPEGMLLGPIADTAIRPGQHLPS